MANTNITLTSLDPDTLKASQINWLQNQSIFRDYDFTGSNMNVLLDVLARNTFINSFYMNMSFSERFNDSAQLRDSLVSKAKELNYIPYSMSSASTSLNITVQANNITTFEIPRGSIFSGQNSNASFSFVTDQNYVVTSSNNTFTFANVVVYEGYYKSDLFSVDNSVNNQLFTFSSPNIDTNSLSVYVAENAGSTNTIFTQAKNLYGLNSNSHIYFLQAAASNTYQIQFGDGVMGYLPQSGSTVVATYRVTNGEDANFINMFSLSSSLAAYNNGSGYSASITPLNSSSGGSSAESLDSIRFNNPRHYQTQENAVTTRNFKTLILDNFPSIADCSVYSGGITATGVQFGIIFIALVTTNGNPATAALKNQIQTFIQNYDIINYQVMFVDPSFLYIQVTSNVHVDFTQSTISASDYKTEVSNNIINFSSNNLQKFTTPFRYSKLVQSINDIDESILSNETSIVMRKDVNVILNTNASAVLSFNNPITGMASSPFVVGSNTYVLTDKIVPNTPSSLVYVIQYFSNNAVINPTQVGTVSYANGYINLTNMNISGYPDGYTSLSIYANPQNQDIYPVGNDIIEVDSIGGLFINIANN